MSITRCSERWCRRVFRAGESTCPECGAPKPIQTAQVIFLGGTPRERQLLEDAIDDQFNSATFSGALSLRLACLEEGRWKLGAVAHQPLLETPDVLSSGDCEGLIRKAVESIGFVLES